MGLPRIDIRHERIISEVEKGSIAKTVLNVGAGDCKVDYHLIKKGYKVYSTDYKREKHFDDKMQGYFSELDYSISNVFDLNTFPVKQADVVMCCEVLEHLVDYKEAFKNLLNLTKKRLIIGVPWRRSFFMPGEPPIGHCNFWDDEKTENYKSIYEFEKMCSPHKFYAEKILTKPEDEQRGQKSYVCIIDKV